MGGVSEEVLEIMCRAVKVLVLQRVLLQLLEDTWKDCAVALLMQKIHEDWSVAKHAAVLIYINN